MESLAGAAARGVRVRLLRSGDPDGDDANAPERRQLAPSGVQVRLARGVYIHAKAIVADGRRAFVGSQNLTATSLDQNRELGIVLDDPASLSRIVRTFERDFATGYPDRSR